MKNPKTSNPAARRNASSPLRTPRSEGPLPAPISASVYPCAFCLKICPKWPLLTPPHPPFVPAPAALHWLTSLTLPETKEIFLSASAAVGARASHRVRFRKDVFRCPAKRFAPAGFASSPLPTVRNLQSGQRGTVTADDLRSRAPIPQSILNQHE